MLSPSGEAYIAEAWVSAARQAEMAAADHRRPSLVLRPALSIDGDQWCALYGDNLQDGVAGFGGSPAEAYRDFDRAWTAPLVAPAPETKP